MLPTPHPKPWQVSLILAMGILAVSTAAVFVRLSLAAAETQGVGFSLFLAASRMAITALILLPVWRSVAQSRPSRSSLGYAAAAGVLLAVHFAFWITSLSYTSIVASTTLVTTNPIWVALISWIWFGEKMSWQRAIGIGIALSGSLLVGLGDAGGDAGSAPILGDFLALAGAWAVSLYFLLGREAQRRGLGTTQYITVAYSTAAIVLLPLPGIFQTPYEGYPGAVYGYVLLMAIVPQLIGHTSFNWAVRWVSPTLVTLTILFEPVFASLLGYFLFREVPKPLVLVGAGVILAGVAIAVLGSRVEKVSDPER
ncbi:MAG: DMT family transporter [Leptolyngbyaceae cyanobacterium bins.59]|nr:DMT family transporter [Leptolyngbyaceae cyanobacterium bins.59]